MAVDALVAAANGAEVVDAAAADDDEDVVEDVARVVEVAVVVVVAAMTRAGMVADQKRCWWCSCFGQNLKLEQHSRSVKTGAVAAPDAARAGAGVLDPSFSEKVECLSACWMLGKRAERTDGRSVTGTRGSPVLKKSKSGNKKNNDDFFSRVPAPRPPHNPRLGLHSGWTPR